MQVGRSQVGTTASSRDASPSHPTRGTAIVRVNPDYVVPKRSWRELRERRRQQAMARRTGRYQVRLRLVLCCGHLTPLSLQTVVYTTWEACDELLQEYARWSELRTAVAQVAEADGFSLIPIKRHSDPLGNDRARRGYLRPLSELCIELHTLLEDEHQERREWTQVREARWRQLEATVRLWSGLIVTARAQVLLQPAPSVQALQHAYRPRRRPGA